jgi:hypothetical protein
LFTKLVFHIRKESHANFVIEGPGDPCYCSSKEIVMKND